VLPLIDEFSQECFAVRVARRIAGIEIIESLSDAMVMHGVQSTDTLSHELDQKFGCVTMIDENYTIEDHDCLGYRTHGWFMGFLFWTVVGVVLSVLTWLQFQDWR